MNGCITSPEAENASGVYLDAAATVRPLPEAMAAYSRAATDYYGNPSSVHGEGLRAARLLCASRWVILRSLGCRVDAAGGHFDDKTLFEAAESCPAAPVAPASAPRLVFTSGGTEADNLALLGVAHAKSRNRGGRIIVSDGEHPAVRRCCELLAEEGFEIVLLPTEGGILDENALCRALTAPAVPPYTGKPLLLSVMTVNNETGAHYDIAGAFAAAKRICPEIVTHTDATQAFGRVPLDASRLGADLITLSAHKIGGVRGIGALWIAGRLAGTKGIIPTNLGGGQEGGLRSGTENLPAIAAFAAAVLALCPTPAAAASHGDELRDSRDYLLSRLPAEVAVNSPREPAPHILSLRLPGIRSETMLRFLSERGVFISAGSACSAKSAAPSAALTAFGLDKSAADSTVRVSLDGSVGRAGLDRFLAALADGCAALARRR